MAAGGRDPVTSRPLVRRLAYCATSSYIIHDISKIQITILTESPMEHLKCVLFGI